MKKILVLAGLLCSIFSYAQMYEIEADGMPRSMSWKLPRHSVWRQKRKFSVWKAQKNILTFCWIL